MSIFGRKEIAALKAELAEKERELDRIKELLAGSISNVEKNSNEEDSEYYFNTFRDKIVQDKKLAASIYARKYEFMSWREYKLYELLCEISTSDNLKNYGLKVFAQVRLADIVKLWEDTLDEFKNHILYQSGGEIRINHSKEKVYAEMEEANFDNKKYKQTFLYTLLRSHVDFLICRPWKDTLAPLMAIELFGQEHFDPKNINLRINDEFKKFLFDAVEIGFDNSLTNKAIDEASENKDKLCALKSKLEGKILGAIRDYDERINRTAENSNEANYN
ncbi:MAG: DUF2726 domain-containing protein [Oscillospiraceae bacterium]|nr:DUF2726 domain-containing protein [Oscillospiraceae bacterium]